LDFGFPPPLRIRYCDRVDVFVIGGVHVGTRAATPGAKTIALNMSLTAACEAAPGQGDDYPACGRDASGRREAMLSPYLSEILKALGILLIAIGSL
jgi:hypothetical protein